MKFTDLHNAIDISVLKSFVPLHGFNDAQLRVLVRDIREEYLYAGQQLVDSASFDGCLIYLLSGDITLTTSDQEVLEFSDSKPESHWPLPVTGLGGCSLQASTDAVLLVVNARQMDEMLCWSQAATHTLLQMASMETIYEEHSWLLTLANSGLFFRIPAMNMSRVIQAFDLCIVEPGEVIVEQGDAADYCYVLREGYANVYQDNGTSAEPKHLAILEPGDCFGEDAFIHDAPRNATVVMDSPGIVMRLARRTFFELLKPPVTELVPLSRALKLCPEGSQWIDVRTLPEFDAGHIKEALHIPLDLLAVKSRILDREGTYICYCNSGCRAKAVAWFLQEQGYNAIAVEASLGQVLDAFNAGPVDITPAARGLLAVDNRT